METVIKGLALGIGAIVIVALLSVVGGTIVFWIWPHCIPQAFPGLVENGVIAGELTWKTAVFLTWVFGILIKASQTNTNK